MILQQPTGVESVDRLLSIAATILGLLCIAGAIDVSIRGHGKNGFWQFVLVITGIMLIFIGLTIWGGR